MWLVVALLSLTVAGCATRPLPPAQHGLDYRERAESQTKDGLRVSASVLSADESHSVYGVPLADAGIQPVWLEVENGHDVAYWLLSPGLDPHFFPPSEAADIFAVDGERTALEQVCQDLAFRNPVPPGRTVSGFVLARLGFVWARGADGDFRPADAVAGGRFPTDGLRAVMFFAARPLKLSETEIVDWIPALQLREAQAEAEALPAAREP